MKNNRLLFCPDCGAKLIEDAWEIITELPNGDLVQDIIYPAWVCSDFCGYYEKIKL